MPAGQSFHALHHYWTVHIPKSVDAVRKIVKLVGRPGFVDPVLQQKLIAGFKTGLSKAVETSVAIFLTQH